MTYVVLGFVAWALAILTWWLLTDDDGCAGEGDITSTQPAAVSSQQPDGAITADESARHAVERAPETPIPVLTVTEKAGSGR